VGKAKKNAYDVINAVFQEVKDDPRVISLGCERVISDAKVSYDSLMKMVRDIDHWMPNDFKVKRDKGEATMKLFSERFQLLLDYHGSLKVVKGQLKLKDDADDRKLRRRRKTLQEEFVCNKQLANAITTALEDLDDSRVHNTIAHCPYASDIIDGGSLRASRLFADVLPKAAVPHYYAIVEAMKNSSKDAASKFTDGGIKALRSSAAKAKTAADASTHAVCALPAHHVAWNNPDDKEELFSLAKGEMTPVLYVQKNWHHSQDLENCPLQGLAHVMTCVRGFVYVVVCDLDDVIEKKKGIETISQYCEDIGSRNLQKLSQFGLKEGASLWIPYGYVAIPIGIADPEVIDEEDMYCSFVNHYCLDTSQASKATAVATCEIVAYAAKSVARELKVFKDNGPILQEFCKCITPEIGLKTPLVSGESQGSTAPRVEKEEKDCSEADP
jgi:hypothetical protein